MCNVFSDTQDGSKEPYSSTTQFIKFLFMKYIKKLFDVFYSSVPDLYST